MAGDEGDAPDDGSGVVTDQAPGREGTGRTFDGVDTGGQISFLVDLTGLDHGDAGPCHWPCPAHTAHPGGQRPDGLMLLLPS